MMVVQALSSVFWKTRLKNKRLLQLRFCECTQYRVLVIDIGAGDEFWVVGAVDGRVLPGYDKVCAKEELNEICIDGWMS